MFCFFACTVHLADQLVCGSQDTVPALKRKLDEMQIQNMELIKEAKAKQDMLYVQVGVSLVN